MRRSKQNAFKRGGKHGKGGSSGGVMSSRGQMSGTSTSENALPLFPAKTEKMLRYATDINLTNTAGVLSTWVFSANGMYDPDISSTGHQPMGFDTMMSYYEHYHVHRANIKVIFRNILNASGFVSLRLDADVTPLASPNQMMENGRVVYDTLDNNGGTFMVRKLSMGVNIPRNQGLTRSNFLADSNLRGGIASNPVEQTYFHIGIHNTLAQNMQVHATVIIEYWAYFTEPRPLSQSLLRMPPPGSDDPPHGSELKTIPDPVSKQPDPEPWGNTTPTTVPVSPGTQLVSPVYSDGFNADGGWARVCTCHTSSSQ